MALLFLFHAVKASSKVTHSRGLALAFSKFQLLALVFTLGRDTIFFFFLTLETKGTQYWKNTVFQKML